MLFHDFSYPYYMISIPSQHVLILKIMNFRMFPSSGQRDRYPGHLLRAADVVVQWPHQTVRLCGAVCVGMVAERYQQL